MKSKIAVLALALAALFTPACEKHSWTETKQLFQEHHEEGHGAAHEGKEAGHGEKKAEGHGEAKHE